MDEIHEILTAYEMRIEQDDGPSNQEATSTTSKKTEEDNQE